MSATPRRARIYRGFKKPNIWVWRCGRDACLQTGATGWGFEHVHRNAVRALDQHLHTHPEHPTNNKEA